MASDGKRWQAVDFNAADIVFTFYLYFIKIYERSESARATNSRLFERH